MRNISPRWILLGALAGATALGAGCGNTKSSDGFSDGTSGDGGTSAQDGDTFGTNPAFGDAAAGALVITPPNPVLDVNVPTPGTQQFTAISPGGGGAIQANWSVDNVQIGTIDGSGLFKSGTLGGQATVTAQSGNLKGSTTVTVRLHIVENPGAVDPGTQGTLAGGGTADATFGWLYPYDQTVFPRGLLPPTLQFAGQAPTATYVHVTSKNLEYKGFFGASTPGRVSISPATWATITKSVGPSDPVKVEVTKSTAGAITGPITETWTIAQGSLKGTVYYNTYNSPLANGGAVMRIKPGASADVLSGGCTVCHAVSAQGNVLVSQGGPSANDGTAYGTGTKIDLKTLVKTPRPDPLYGFGGVYPDGSLMLTAGVVAGAWPPNVPGLSGERPSQLLDLATGQPVASPGMVGIHALMPSFSPDGKKVAFNHYDQGGGHSLSVMDFDLATKTFSGIFSAVSDPGSFLGWPAFLPDTKSFVFGATTSQDYATWQGSHGDLYALDLATKTKVPLDAANGVRNGQPYIPYGAEDLHLNYEPTVLPIAVGGYYWAVYTSRRRLGNVITGGDPWGNADRKKLWVVAIDLNPTAGKDPSHVPFYLEGQELAAGNMRGFWALDPCKQNGNSCESGDECCNGFCRQVTGDGGAPVLACVAPPTGCANVFEKCATAADCCDAALGVQCIAGHCASPAPR